LEWKKLIESYFEERETLKLCCLILDARRGWMANDLDLKQCWSITADSTW